jgi:hypothetical protein
MANVGDLMEIQCPCCDAVLRVDPVLGVVISHKIPEKPLPIQDLAAEVARIKGEGARLEQAFQKSFDAHKSQSTVLNKKFDELLKQAKENPDQTPPKRDIDL